MTINKFFNNSSLFPFCIIYCCFNCCRSCLCLLARRFRCSERSQSAIVGSVVGHTTCSNTPCLWEHYRVCAHNVFQSNESMSSLGCLLAYFYSLLFVSIALCVSCVMCVSIAVLWRAGTGWTQLFFDWTQALRHTVALDSGLFTELLSKKTAHTHLFKKPCMHTWSPCTTSSYAGEPPLHYGGIILAPGFSSPPGS